MFTVCGWKGSSTVEFFFTSFFFLFVSSGVVDIVIILFFAIHPEFSFPLIFFFSKFPPSAYICSSIF